MPAIAPYGPVIPDVATFAAAYSAAVPSRLSSIVGPYGYPDILAGSVFPFAAPSCLSAALPNYLSGSICGSALPVASYLPAISACY